MNSYFFCNKIVEGLRSLRNFDIGRQIEVSHVMWTVIFLTHKSFSCWSKCFNSIVLSFLHFFIGVGLNARNCLASVYLVWLNWMPIQIFNHFNWEHLSFYLNLVRLHSLLYLSSNFSQPCIDARLSHSSVCSIFDCLQQSIVSRIKCNCKCAINDSTLDVCSKIDFANVVIRKDCVISRIGCIMGCDVV